jgi:hypothetical protein
MKPYNFYRFKIKIPAKFSIRYVLSKMKNLLLRILSYIQNYLLVIDLYR